MLTGKYTCIGGVRGSCGVVHRTIKAAYRCCSEDMRACNKVHGYSDRHIRHADGSRLNEEEVKILYSYKGNGY